MNVDLTTAIALISTITATVFGVAGLVRAFRVDKATATQAVGASRGAEVQQIIDGLNGMVENLQEDNLITRESAQRFSVLLTECGARLTECVKERADLQRQLNDLKSH